MYVNIHILKIGKTNDLAVLNISLFTHTFVNTQIFLNCWSNIGWFEQLCGSATMWLTAFSLKELKTWFNLFLYWQKEISHSIDFAFAYSVLDSEVYT